MSLLSKFKAIPNEKLVLQKPGDCGSIDVFIALYDLQEGKYLYYVKGISEWKPDPMSLSRMELHSSRCGTTGGKSHAQMRVYSLQLQVMEFY